MAPETNTDPALTQPEIERSTPATNRPVTNWETIFPFDEPYPDQRRAIETTREPLEAGGFVVAELACGTGKTLFALSRGIELVRDPTTSYKRLLCLTSVKQQLCAFEDDLQTINANLPAPIPPISALTLVGKADMCSYVDAGTLDDDRIYNHCERLREPVQQAIANAEYVPDRLAELAKKGRVDPMSTEQPIETDEWMSPYAQGYPTVRNGNRNEDDDESDDGPSRGEYCPFYAEYRRETWGDETGRYSPTGVMRPEELRAEASADGLCPHAVMGDAIESAEVIVANYYHAFDPITVSALTGSIIDGETLVVCDEAHMVVPRVRELLSDSLSRHTLQNAIDELQNQILDQSNNAIAATMRGALAETEVSEEELETFLAFLQEAKDWLDHRSLIALDDNNADWEQAGHEELASSIEKPLRDPLTPQPDTFSDWVADAGYTETFAHADRYGRAVTDAIKAATEQHRAYTRRKTYTKTVGRVFQRWVECDHEQYFREIELQKRYRRDDEQDLAWAKHYSAHMMINNCLPAEEIATRFDHFGGGILMSATLAPLDVYRRTVGLDLLEDDGCPVTEIVAGLPFPEDNRESCAVDLPKFTYNHRGSTESWKRDAEQDELRERYATAIQAVVRTTAGNVLIAMPSYAEGEWAAEVVRSDPAISKSVLVDESSTNDETEALKAKFFAGDGKVLVTSLRGTLTEGVDYDGDRLSACISCGVPIRAINGPLPKAIKTAYEREFGKRNGFDHAFTVPAVRKSRQALGRVIRGHDDIGVRVLVDRRWASSHKWDDVRKYLPRYERDDYHSMEATELTEQLQAFWNDIDASTND